MSMFTVGIVYEGIQATDAKSAAEEVVRRINSCSQKGLALMALVSYEDSGEIAGYRRWKQGAIRTVVEFKRKGEAQPASQDQDTKPWYDQ